MPTGVINVERWAEHLALVIAYARFGPGVEVFGRHNPKPSERAAARAFMELVAENPSAESRFGPEAEETRP